MSITAIIVDDEKLAREELKYLLDQVGGVDIVAQGTNGVEALNLIEEHEPDVVFLDVQMPGLDGFAVIKRLAEQKGRLSRLPQFIFATAYDQYAVRAFEVNAVDYLLKPFDPERIRNSVQRAKDRIHDNTGKENDTLQNNALQMDTLLRLLNRPLDRPHAAKLVVQMQSRLMLVDQGDICYAVIEEGVIRIVTQSFEGQSKCRTLEELLDQLDPAIFWRAHRGFVVNINHIREVVPWFKSSYQLRMDDKQKMEIPVSRTQTKRLKELFNL